MALHLMYYNLVRIDKTLRTTPAMAAKVIKRLREIGDIVDVLEAWETRPRVDNEPQVISALVGERSC